MPRKYRQYVCPFRRDAGGYQPGVGFCGVVVQALAWSQESTEIRLTLRPFQLVALVLTQPPYWLTTVPPLTSRTGSPALANPSEPIFPETRTNTALSRGGGSLPSSSTKAS